MAGTEHLKVERENHVLIVTMNRPEAKNALSPAMLVGMADAWKTLNEDDDLRCAILTGSGGSFCTGCYFRIERCSTGRRKIQGIPRRIRGQGDR